MITMNILEFLRSLFSGRKATQPVSKPKVVHGERQPNLEQQEEDNWWENPCQQEEVY